MIKINFIKKIAYGLTFKTTYYAIQKFLPFLYYNNKLSLNFLPWREQQHEERRKNFIFALFIVILLALILIALLHVIVVQQIRDQTQQNQLLQHKIIQFDKVTNFLPADQLAAMEQNIQFIHRLTQKRGKTSWLWYQLAHLMPKDAMLTSLSRQGNIVSLTGQSRQTAAVYHLIHSLSLLNRIELLRLQSLEQIKKSENNNHYRFKISFEFKSE